ncbi:hypothetical protein FRC06_010633, partial [Ceratobasidium sp. 370]
MEFNNEKPLLDDDAVRELRRLVKGTVYRCFDPGFVRHSQLFNAAIRSRAQLLVRPLDTRDVSEVVKFCSRHDLSLSAKSGGYGTHGWAVEGDLILDMRLIAQITIERPLTDPDKPDWSSLRDSPHVPVADPDTLKGKGRMPPASTFSNDHPTGVGPPPIHVPFTDPQRRSADEAFSTSPVVIVAPDTSPVPQDKDRMQVDGEEKDSPVSGSERPVRRLRVTSTGSGRTSHASATSTPPMTASPLTPADEVAKLGANQKDQPDTY